MFGRVGVVVYPVASNFGLHGVGLIFAVLILPIVGRKIGYPGVVLESASSLCFRSGWYPGVEVGVGVLSWMSHWAGWSGLDQ